MKLYCFGITGLPLSDLAYDALYNTACRMAKSGQNKMRLVHDDIRGIVTTKFESVVVGGTAGIVFKASFDTMKGSSRITFMVRDFDHQEPGKWQTTPLRLHMRRIPKPSNN